MIGPNLLNLRLPWTIAVLLLGALEYLMPELTRPEVVFSVTVAPTLRASAEGVAIVHRYRRIVAMTTVVALLVALNAIAPLARWNGALAFALQYVGFVMALSIARRQTRPYAAPQPTTREADLVARKASAVLIVAIAIPSVVIGAIALWSSARWEALPDPYPIHWMWNGEPDTWVSRTPFNVYGMLSMLGGACALMAILCFGLMFWSRRPRSIASSRFDRRFLTGTIAALLVGEYLLAASAMLPLGFGANGPELMIFVILATASIYLMTAGNTAPIETSRGDVTPDQAWKFGIIYFNREDPAFLVEKRFGLGWTLNFGHRLGWVVVGGALLPIALGVAFIISIQI